MVIQKESSFNPSRAHWPEETLTQGCGLTGMACRGKAVEK